MKRTFVPALLALLLVPVAQAVDEADAPALRSDVEAVWHAPDVPEPGTQWNGFIRLVEGHNITAVAYQICIVGENCFAPPTPADRVDDTTWSYDTADYKAGANPIDWGVNHGGRTGPWRVGTQFFLTFDDGNTVEFPHGVGLDDPRCQDDGDLGWIGCSETHYIAWDLPAVQASAGNDAPAPGLLPALLVALGLVALRRQRH